MRLSDAGGFFAQLAMDVDGDGDCDDADDGDGDDHCGFGGGV